MNLHDLIEQTLDYRWRNGAHNRHFQVHTYPHEGYHSRPYTIMVSPHEGDYAASIFELKQTLRVRRDEIVLIPAHYNLRVHQPQAGRQSYAHIQFTILGALDPLSLYELPWTVRGKSAKPISQALRELTATHCSETKDLLDVARRKSSAFRLLELLLSVGKLRTERAERLHQFPRIEPVVSHITNHLNGDLSRERLAVLAGLSPSRFGQLFQEIMGSPPKAYVREQRQRRAAELLGETDLNMAEIAERTGYCDQFEFSRRFKQRWGVPPLAYRQAIRQFDGHGQ